MMNILNTMLMTMSLKAKNFMAEEEGEVNIVSIVVLIGIAVLLAIIFRDAIEDLLTTMFGTIEQNATGAIETTT